MCCLYNPCKQWSAYWFYIFGDLPKSYPIFPMAPSLRKSCRGILLGHWRHIGMLTKPQDTAVLYTVPKEINFSRYDMKCSGESVILRGIFLVVSCSPLHFMLSRNHYHYHYRVQVMSTVCTSRHVVLFHSTSRQRFGSQCSYNQLIQT